MPKSRKTRRVKRFWFKGMEWETVASFGDRQQPGTKLRIYWQTVERSFSPKVHRSFLPSRQVEEPDVDIRDLTRLIPPHVMAKLVAESMAYEPSPDPIAYQGSWGRTLENQIFTIDEVMNAFRIPPGLIGNNPTTIIKDEIDDE